MKQVAYIVLFLFIWKPVLAQKAFEYSQEEFIESVLKNHPVVKQAGLLNNRAAKTEQMARGGFDPKIEASNQLKSFNDKQYYRLTEGVLKIPTWFGLEVKGGYENNQGLYLNPENNVPMQGLWYGGLSMPIGQGLFIDERRASLKMAELYNLSTKAEQAQILNQLLLDANLAYWDWFEAWNKFEVYQNAVKVSKERLTGLKLGVVSGDLPPIDTIEARLQVQTLEVGMEDAGMEEQKKRLYMSTFLWLDNDIPLELSAAAQAPKWQNLGSNNFALDSVLIAINQITETHPEILAYNYKLKNLEIERKLKIEKLKPVLNLNYYPLSSAAPGELENFTTSNYKFGLNFSMPILLRKERADLGFTKIKIQETNYSLQLKNLEIRNKAKAALVEYQATTRQVEIYQSAVKGYETMLSAEKDMLDLGESSIFLVNSREQKWVSAQLKLVELISKNRQSVAKINYSLAKTD